MLAGVQFTHGCRNYTVNLLGHGSQNFAEQVLGWYRGPIRKGQLELQTGQSIKDRFHERGRRRAEDRLPHLLEDIRAILDPVGQTDPTFRSSRIYSPLSAEEVRFRLIHQKGYKDTELPSIRTLRNKLNELDYRLRKVKKCKPLKKIAQTDAIFDTVHQINETARANARNLGAQQQISQIVFVPTCSQPIILHAQLHGFVVFKKI